MGSCANLGGQDGHPDGGAVGLAGIGAQRGGAASVLALLLAMGVSLAACTKQNTSPPPDAASLLRAIPPADPTKYSTQHEAKHWSNPYLVIRPDAVGLLTGVAANEEQILKPEDVSNALARLPGTAWPDGRAVAILVEEKPGASDADKIAIRRSRGIVEGDLRGADVAIQWISATP
jgi:hypothetical protein